MPSPSQSRLRIVLHEGAGAEPLAAEQRFEAMKALLERGFAVSRSVGDGIPYGGPAAPVLVLGAFGPRSGTPQFDAQAAQFPPPQAGRSGDGCPARFLDLTGRSAAQIAEAVEQARAEAQAAPPGEWKPWFPVIDFDRCTHCMQCLSFCLFGVYGVDGAHRLEVQSAESCKTNCPACSRVCPEAAIIFPKYKTGPINGDEINDADLAREKMKIDVSALLGGDIYDLLRERSERARTRFSKERDPQQALQERRRCLAQLVQTMDLPPEVLMALPSPEEIQRRAEEAKARAQAALARNP